MAANVHHSVGFNQGQSSDLEVLDPPGVRARRERSLRDIGELVAGESERFDAAQDRRLRQRDGTLIAEAVAGQPEPAQ
jgi:hypothetical protein